MMSEGQRARRAIKQAGGLVGLAEARVMLDVAYGSRGNLRPMLETHGIRPVAELGIGPVFLRCEVEPLVEARKLARRDSIGRAYVGTQA